MVESESARAVGEVVGFFESVKAVETISVVNVLAGIAGVVSTSYAVVVVRVPAPPPPGSVGTASLLASVNAKGGSQLPSIHFDQKLATVAASRRGDYMPNLPSKQPCRTENAIVQGQLFDPG